MNRKVKKAKIPRRAAAAAISQIIEAAQVISEYEKQRRNQSQQASEEIAVEQR